jgi:hypothetical protein
MLQIFHAVWEDSGNWPEGPPKATWLCFRGGNFFNIDLEANDLYWFSVQYIVTL